MKPGEIIKFTARNYKGRHKRLRAGNIWLAEMEIERETWDDCDEIPDDAIIEVTLYYHDGDNPQVVERAEAKIKGEYGIFWNGMCKRGLLSALDLRQALNRDDADEAGTKEALYDLFDVKSLSQISPSDFSRWAASEHLNNIVMMAAQVVDQMQQVN